MSILEAKDAMNEAIVARGCFIVDIKISKGNDVELTIESEQGVVTLEDCVALSKIFEEKFDREVEDYSLTVTSAGLDQPFKVVKQYLKAVGTEVEVSIKGGRRFTALLSAADENGVTIDYYAKEVVEGKKKKEVVHHSETLPYSQITGMRPHISIKDD